ncbi:RraA family protein [Kineococcus sp. SYSU DK003]|uniref:RraA family protein n=1 Tax=Kineococcus sp. SYSU DK003 TaxID=3383124 RepID=UPI003D7DB554
MAKLDLSVRVDKSWTRADPELVAALGEHPVAHLGDAMQRLGICDGGITPVWRGARCAGSAVTVVGPAGDNLAVIEAMETVVETGDILVVNGFGHVHRGLVGDQISSRLQARGVVGAVIDGAVRDRARIEEIRFPVWARGANPAGPFKNGPGAIGEPVAVGGVVCASGDVVVADDDGVVVIPAARAEQIHAAVLQVHENEARMSAEVHTAY